MKCYLFFFCISYRKSNVVFLIFLDFRIFLILRLTQKLKFIYLVFSITTKKVLNMYKLITHIIV